VSSSGKRTEVASFTILSSEPVLGGVSSWLSDGYTCSLSHGPGILDTSCDWTGSFSLLAYSYLKSKACYPRPGVVSRLPTEAKVSVGQVVNRPLVDLI
jgi:hypothetical protein